MKTKETEKKQGNKKISKKNFQKLITYLEKKNK